MPQVHSQALKRRYFAPFASGAHLFVLLSYIAVVIFAFLIAYFTHNLWVKEASYREQPHVSYVSSLLVKLQGVRGASMTPFELMYSTIPTINDRAGESVRIPIVRSAFEDSNLDLIPDVWRVNLTFPLEEQDLILGVQGVFLFNYKLRNLVRVDMEAPITVAHSGGVPGRALYLNGRLALKLANPLPVLPSVRGNEYESILPKDRIMSLPESSFPAIMAKVASRNDSTVLDPVTSAWEVKYTPCGLDCSFTLGLTINIPEEKVLYIPSFIEVAKFSWIQFLSTAIFLMIFVRPLINFVIENQVVHSVVRDDHPKQKIY
mmetsp:Transcript_16072/g.39092  ORF Transcript_16072/g.39092 Transcript_16072/m.39092 type:complete len:318 (+) Transcript_16072:17-970(+)